MKINVTHSLSDQARQLDLMPFAWRRPNAAEPIPVFVQESPYDWIWPKNPEIQDVLMRERRFIRVPRQVEYWPLTEAPEIAQVFASLDGSEESFGQFAARFGGLGVEVETESEPAEPLFIWKVVRREIQVALRLLELADGGADIAALADSVVIQSHRIALRPQMRLGLTRFSRAPVLLTELPAEVETTISAHRSQRVRLQFAARAIAARIASGWIQGGVLPVLVSVEINLQFIPETNLWGVRFKPNCLAAAMWLQVAKVLEGGVSYRQCASPRCSEWLVVSTNRKSGKRSDARFCDGKCRVAAHRLNRVKGGRDGKAKREG